MLFFAVLGIAYGLVTYHYDRLPFSSTKIYENADDDEIEVIVYYLTFFNNERDIRSWQDLQNCRL